MKSYRRLDYDTIDSTNTEAKRLFLNGVRENTLVCARHQSAGRGRSNRFFYSPANTGIYMTVLVPLKTSLNDVIAVTTAVSVYTAEALERFAGIKPGIKWVNDIYVNGRKACGILAEAVFDGTDSGIVVGVGINVSTEVFPDDIKEIATGIGEIGAEAREKVTDYIATKVCEFCDNPKDRSYMDTYRRLSLCLGHEVTFIENGINTYATAEDIDDEGGLIVRTEDGKTRTLNSGEISLRLGRL